MKKPYEPAADWDELRWRILGLGAHSIHKSHYPELQRRLTELQASEEKYRTLVSNLNVGVFRATATMPGRFVEINPAGARLLGIDSFGGIAAVTVDACFGNKEDWGTLLREVTSRGSIRNYDVTLRRADGSLVWLSISAVVHHSTSGDWVDAVAEDITRRKSLEEDLRNAKLSAERARDAAEEANRAKDHFLAVLSHELRTPLAPVMTGLSLLSVEQALTERGQKCVEIIQRNVALESRLIDDLLDVNRIARGKVELDRRCTELGAIIERAVEVCRPDIDARRLHFALDMGTESYIVDGDAARLQQVFWNLLKNAIKFTPHGGCVGMRCNRQNGHVVVEVIDSGIGIDKPALEHIFDAFAQAERSITRQFGGLGLGLAISKALIELHGGTIEASSEGVHRGATFRVRLPIVAEPARGSEGARANSESQEPPHRKLRILLVEDHGDTAAMLRTVLELEGHHVETAGDVSTALETAARAGFDLLLSDLGLPDGSGIDLMRQLRARGLIQEGIALTGYGQEHDIRQSREAGFYAHLVKPVQPARLREVMERVVSR